MKISKQPLDIMPEATPWLDAVRQKGRSRSTVANYVSVLRNLGRFLASRGKTALASASLEDLAAWQQSLAVAGMCPGSIDLFVRSVRGYYTWCVQTGQMFADPSRTLSFPKFQRPLGVCPSETDMRRWLDSLNGTTPIAIRDRALIEVAYATGARLHELAQLNINALDTTNGVLRILGKGCKERMVPLTTLALRALQLYFEKSRPILLRGREDVQAMWIGSRQGNPLKAQALSYLIERSAAQVGLRLTSHAVRRAFATHLLRCGAHLPDIKVLLGHSGYWHLRHYLRLSSREVIETLRKSKPGRR